ncbi:hypothetical protein K402DRAFT_457542 [Aulographum hederae CBS 113979]|uniref:Mediator of RNA polymerase II transcription subunit 7 n=1 Tax=Aulographum hederae CBS 113979 TaxID=1176131 RepID=A0A6G1GN04_9PEZI|nr:hypothetical protein K402DRAFT_457542 [Aulographum hederae CBS 113979]
MAEPQEHQLKKSFPEPPPFYQYFTPQNSARLAKHQKDGADLDISKLPSDLRNLVPPKPTPVFRVFGAKGYSNPRNPVFEDIRVHFPNSYLEQKYPALLDSASLDRPFYLKKLTRSIMVDYLTLMGLLSQSPEPTAWAPVNENIRNSFVNVLQLVNEYRPHQARESMIMMMEEQLERGNKEIDDIKNMKEKVENVMEQLQREQDKRAAAMDEMDQDMKESGGFARRMTSGWLALKEDGAD